MNDLTILHLSDLHIDGQAAYPEILKNLLVHIKEEIAPTREKLWLLLLQEILSIRAIRRQ